VRSSGERPTCYLKAQRYCNKNLDHRQAMVVHAYKPSALEIRWEDHELETKPGLHSKILSQKTKQNKKNKKINYMELPRTNNSTTNK
jgi:hypothetical protein